MSGLLVLVRLEEWVALAIAVAGVAFGVMFARDNWADLMAYKAQGWNGFAERSARIGVRSGRAKAILHSLLGVLPAYGVATNPTPARLAQDAVIFAVIIFAQGTVVGEQLLNQRDRQLIRVELTARAADASESVS